MDNERFEERFEEMCAEVDTYWGDRMPMMAMEEAGEFIQAISKLERGQNGAGYNLVKEMADMLIAIEAIRHHYGIDPEALVDAIGEKLNKKY